MTATGVAGFWSYSRQDDEHDGHGVTRLAKHIMDEFALVTGETLTLFLDRTDIRWGEEWRRRIDASLAETTFFIPIVTPLYFKRPECRRELLSFVGQARSLGAIDLVMPILYVDVPDLTEDSADEACALVARMQHTDWRHIRLMAEDSADYRRGVNSLAVRLAEITDRYEQRNSPQVTEGTASSGDYLRRTTEEKAGEDEEGILDILGAVEPKIVSWKNILDDAIVLDRQYVILQKAFIEKMLKAEKSGVSAGTLLNMVRKFCSEAEPIERRCLEKAEAYSSAAVELDPLILLLLRKLTSYPEFSAGVPPALVPIEDAYRRWKKDEPGQRKRAADLLKAANRYKGISKDYARLTRLLQADARLVDDGNSILENWHQEIKRYLEEAASSQSAETPEVIGELENFLAMVQELDVGRADDVDSS
jgi:hypothetical protein